MLPRAFRLTKASDFKKVLKNGLAVHGKFFLAKILKKTDEKQCRLGVIVSNKISKKAVIRNKIKRLVRRVVQESSFLSSQNKNIVIVAKFGAGGADTAQAKQDIKSLLEKILQ